MKETTPRQRGPFAKSFQVGTITGPQLYCRRTRSSPAAAARAPLRVEKRTCGPGLLQRLVRIPCRVPLPHVAGNLNPLRPILPPASGVDARYAVGALSLARSARWFDWAGERFSAHSVGDHRDT